MKRTRALSILLLVAASVGGWFFFQQQEAKKDLVLYGNVDIRQVDVAFRVEGRIAEVLVNEGDAVHEGQVVARLDTDILEQSRHEAAASLQSVEAQLARLEHGYRAEEVAQAKAEVDAARETFASANAELKRLVSLRTIGAVSQRDVDNARAAQMQALSRQRAALEQYQMMSSGYRIEELEAQRGAVSMAQARLELADIRLRDALLRAPQTGIVLTRAREAGAIVQAGQTVFTLSLVNPVWLRVYVEEAVLGLIKPGMPVLISVDSVPGKQYPGTVGFISPSAEFAPKSVETQAVRTDLVYRIRIQADDPENVLRQGMPVTVRVVPGGGENVTTGDADDAKKR